MKLCILGLNLERYGCDVGSSLNNLLMCRSHSFPFEFLQG